MKGLHLDGEHWRVGYVGGKLEVYPRTSLVAQMVKNPPSMQDTLVGFLGQEDPLEKG